MRLGVVEKKGSKKCGRIRGREQLLARNSRRGADESAKGILEWTPVKYGQGA